MAIIQRFWKKMPNSTGKPQILTLYLQHKSVFFNFLLDLLDIRCIFALETSRDRAVGSSSGS